MSIGPPISSRHAEKKLLVSDDGSSSRKQDEINKQPKRHSMTPREKGAHLSEKRRHSKTVSAGPNKFFFFAKKTVVARRAMRDSCTSCYQNTPIPIGTEPPTVQCNKVDATSNEGCFKRPACTVRPRNCRNREASRHVLVLIFVGWNLLESTVFAHFMYDSLNFSNGKNKFHPEGWHC